jgi:Immunity protein 35
MTISSDQAKLLAKKAVSALGAASEDEFLLIEGNTVETDHGWVFFYNTREFIDTGEPTSSLVGNGPIFVSRTGEVRELPSAVPWETSIKSA